MRNEAWMFEGTHAVQKLAGTHRTTFKNLGYTAYTKKYKGGRSERGQQSYEPQQSFTYFLNHNQKDKKKDNAGRGEGGEDLEFAKKKGGQTY